MLRSGMNFYMALGLGCLLTIVLYTAVVFVGPRFGLRL
jgi:hypothetical protein